MPRLSEWTPREVREQQARERQEAEAAVLADNQRLQRELGLATRELVLSGHDPDWFLPEDARGRMSKAKAFEFSVAETRKFFTSEEFAPYCTEENKDAISAYLLRNGVDVIVSETCWKKAFQRLVSLGLLTEKPYEPEPEPVVLTEQQSDPEAIERERKRAYFEDAIYVDPLRPDEKMTAFQLEKADAETYRRVMRIPRGPNTYIPLDGAMRR